MAFDQLSILPTVFFSAVFHPNERFLPTGFRIIVGMTLLLLPLLLFCRGTLLFISFLSCCLLYFSGTECGQIFVKIVKPTFLLPYMPLLSSWRHAHLSHLIPTRNFRILFFVLSLALLPHFPLLITISTASLPGTRLRSSPTT